MTVSPLSRTSWECNAPGGQPVADRLQVAAGGARQNALATSASRALFTAKTLPGPPRGTDVEHGQERHPVRAEHGLVLHEVAPDGGADASVDVANGLLMVPLLPRAHTRASWGKKGPRRSRKSDARRRAGRVFAGCHCARDPDIALGRYIAGAERRVPGVGSCGCGPGGGGAAAGVGGWQLTGQRGVLFYLV